MLRLPAFIVYYTYHYTRVHNRSFVPRGYASDPHFTDAAKQPGVVAPWRARPLRVQLQLYVSVTCSLQIVVQIVA